MKFSLQFAASPQGASESYDLYCCRPPYSAPPDKTNESKNQSEIPLTPPPPHVSPPLDSVKCVMGYTQRFTTAEHQVAPRSAWVQKVSGLVCELFFFSLCCFPDV